MTDIATALFVPATVEHRVRKALGSPADAVIVDLEDGVPEGGKDVARETAAAVLAGGNRPGTALRINGVDTPHFAEDLRLAASLPLDALVLPKASPRALQALDPGDLPVWALIETAVGLRHAYDVAAHPRVALLILGTVDLAADLGLGAREDGLELLHARSTVVLESRAAGIAAPLDGVCLTVGDDDAVRTQAELARSLGFGGKLCIHPNQLSAVKAAFAPSEESLAWAREVIDASDRAEADGLGAVLVAGQMVDLPVVNQARRLLRAATQEDS
jgi:citrate lyase subunit beta/citryl-CoA lyase